MGGCISIDKREKSAAARKSLEMLVMGAEEMDYFGGSSNSGDMLPPAALYRGVKRAQASSSLISSRPFHLSFNLPPTCRKQASEIDIVSNTVNLPADKPHGWEIVYRHPESGFGHVRLLIFLTFLVSLSLPLLSSELFLSSQ
jgi:hypothetical protein